MQELQKPYFYNVLHKNKDTKRRNCDTISCVWKKEQYDTRHLLQCIGTDRLITCISNSKHSFKLIIVCGNRFQSSIVSRNSEYLRQDRWQENGSNIVEWECLGVRVSLRFKYTDGPIWMRPLLQRKNPFQPRYFSALLKEFEVQLCQHRINGLSVWDVPNGQSLYLSSLFFGPDGEGSKFGLIRVL